MTETTDTIYALSSGALPSGVAVIRISGPQTQRSLHALCGLVPEPRIAALRSIRARNGDVLDRGLVLFFKAPASFTGEDCAELQVHGGRAVVQAILAALAELPLRHAEPGEFTRRAFQNGKMDLVEIEGLADLISAQTEMQRKLALEHADGKVSALYEDWSRRLLHARAMIEAEFDFADEDDVPGSISDTIWRDMAVLADEMGGHLAGAETAEIIRDGLTVVIAGPPNAGKSSLMNALARRDVSIVTEVAGTTRDILNVDISLAGFSVRLFDTAGLRDTEDLIEKEGIRRARSTLGKADLVLLLSENAAGFETMEEEMLGLCLKIGTKIDVSRNLWHRIKPDVSISTKTGEGLDTLIEMIASRLPNMSGGASFALPTRARHVDCLNQAVLAIRLALQPVFGLDLRAEHLRIAGDALARITGRIDVEDLLDVIFSKFCIGK